METLARFGLDLPERITVHLDAGYDSAKTKKLLEELGCQGVISKNGTPLQGGARWVVERTSSWHNRGFAKLLICTERRTRAINVFIALANAIITTRRLIRTAWTTHRWHTRPARRPRPIRAISKPHSQRIRWHIQGEQVDPSPPPCSGRYARRGAIEHAGEVLLTRTAYATGLSGGRTPWRKPLAVHDPAKVLTNLACRWCWGGDALCDAGHLRAEPGLYGLVGSEATISRTTTTIGGDAVKALLSVDSTSVRAHQHVADARPAPATGYRMNHKKLLHEPADPAVGRSRGGWTTKIHALTDGLCAPVTMLLSAGQDGGNSILAPLLREHLGAHRQQGLRLLGDKANSHPSTRARLQQMKIKATIPERSDQIVRRKAEGRAGGRPPAFDPESYCHRNTVERGFNRLRQWRGVATRYDKCAVTYHGGVTLAAILIHHRVRQLADTP